MDGVNLHEILSNEKFLEAISGVLTRYRQDGNNCNRSQAEEDVIALIFNILINATGSSKFYSKDFLQFSYDLKIACLVEE